MKIAKFIGNTLETIRQFPPEAKRLAGHAIDNVQQGEMPDDWKPMATVGVGVYEIRIKTDLPKEQYRPTGARGTKEMSELQVQSFSSVWDALEDDPIQRANLKLRSALMIEIKKWYNTSGMTQAEAAKVLGTTRPRLNDVLHGKIDRCTIDRLVNMLEAAGRHVTLSVAA